MPKPRKKETKLGKRQKSPKESGGDESQDEKLSAEGSRAKPRRKKETDFFWPSTQRVKVHQTPKKKKRKTRKDIFEKVRVKKKKKKRKVKCGEGRKVNGRSTGNRSVHSEGL